MGLCRVDLNSFRRKPKIHSPPVFPTFKPEYAEDGSSREAAFVTTGSVTQDVVQQSYGSFLILNPRLKQAARNLLREQDANEKKGCCIRTGQFMEFFPQT